LTHNVWAAKPYPKDFFLSYDLYHAENKIGQLYISFNQKKTKYHLEANLKTFKIMKLYGNRTIISKGSLNLNGFLTDTFEVINKKNTKKNIFVKFNRPKKSIEINYKKEKKQKRYSRAPLDLATLFFQFNFEKDKDNKTYIYDVLEGKKISKFKYKKIGNEIIKVDTKKIKAELFEGLIINKENTFHQLWLSKGDYRIPVKLRLKTNFGLLIDQVLIKTNIPLQLY